MQSRRNRFAARPDREIQVRVIGDELRTHFDQCRIRNMYLQITQKCTGKPFVDQNPAMLRIVPELDDIKSAIFSLKQVSLRSPRILRMRRRARTGMNRINERIRLRV